MSIFTGNLTYLLYRRLRLSALWVTMTGLTMMNTVLASDYLSEIEAETVKLDTGLQMDQSNDTKAEKSLKTEEQGLEKAVASSDEATRQEFETKLKDKYRGSYVFYTKLPLRSREEMVQEYIRGTSFVKIRSKIVNRYMNR